MSGTGRSYPHIEQNQYITLGTANFQPRSGPAAMRQGEAEVEQDSFGIGYSRAVKAPTSRNHRRSAHSNWRHDDTSEAIAQPASADSMSDFGRRSLFDQNG